METQQQNNILCHIFLSFYPCLALFVSLSFLLSSCAISVAFITTLPPAIAVWPRRMPRKVLTKQTAYGCWDTRIVSDASAAGKTVLAPLQSQYKTSYSLQLDNHHVDDQKKNLLQIFPAIS